MGLDSPQDRRLILSLLNEPEELGHFGPKDRLRGRASPWLDGVDFCHFFGN